MFGMNNSCSQLQAHTLKESREVELVREGGSGIGGREGRGVAGGQGSGRRAGRRNS